jgi:hypothetical protein
VLLLALIVVAGSLAVPVWMVYRADRARRWPARRVLRRVRAAVGAGAFRDGSVELDQLVEEEGNDVPVAVRRAAYGQLLTSQWSFVLPLVTVLSLALLRGRLERWATIGGALVLLAYSEGLRRAHVATRAWLRCVDARSVAARLHGEPRALGESSSGLVIAHARGSDEVRSRARPLFGGERRVDDGERGLAHHRGAASGGADGSVGRAVERRDHEARSRVDGVRVNEGDFATLPCRRTTSLREPMCASLSCEKFRAQHPVCRSTLRIVCRHLER